MTDKEAMKLALFALDIVKIHYTQSRHVNEAITALKERLAQLPQRTEQEPDYWLGYGLQAHTEKPFEYATALYRHPLQRKPLTDEQIQKIWDVASGTLPGWSRHIAYARAIEAAHGIKEKT
jgi:hypothetical protein